MGTKDRNRKQGKSILDLRVNQGLGNFWWILITSTLYCDKYFSSNQAQFSETLFCMKVMLKHIKTAINHILYSVLFSNGKLRRCFRLWFVRFFFAHWLLLHLLQNWIFWNKNTFAILNSWLSSLNTTLFWWKIYQLLSWVILIALLSIKHNNRRRNVAQIRRKLAHKDIIT